MSRGPSLNLPTQGVFTDNEDLQRGVRAFEDSARDTVQRTDRRKQDKLDKSKRIVTADYQAKLGELVLYDPTAGGFNVRLPKVTRQDENQEVVVKNTTGSANVVTVWASGNDTVDGAPGVGINAGYYSARFLWDGDTWRLG